MPALTICWNWLAHTAGQSGANRRREELLKAIAAQPALIDDLRIVVLARPHVPATLAHPNIVFVRAWAPAIAELRAPAESLALRRVVRERSCEVVLQEKFPVPRVAARVVTTVHDLRALHRELPETLRWRAAAAPRVLKN